MSNFSLDPRLAASSIFIADLELCQMRLNNDARWPWLVLVPRCEDVREIIDLSVADQTLLFGDIRTACHAVKSLAQFADFRVDKLNVANLGNIVAQLHVHVIARNCDDANWPNPVWGFGQAKAYESVDLETVVERLTKLTCAS